MTIRLCPYCKKPLKVSHKKIGIEAAKGRPYQKEYFKRKKIAKILSLKEIERQMSRKHK